MFLAASETRSHAEHDMPRYVASTGADVGRCDNLFRPCRTISYAASQAGKGDRILVAAGTYEVESGEDLFYLTSGIVRFYGGFDRFDHFQKQAPADNPTTLVGVPIEFRQRLAGLGFNVIADRKGLSAEVRKASAQLADGFAAMQTSTSAAACVNGQADGFACSNVGLHSHLALGDFASRPSAGNDVWGFLDLNTEREYAIVGLANGTAVVDVTVPQSPVEIGFAPGQSSVWRDIKVYQFFDSIEDRWKAYAYVTTDAANDRLSIIDLTGLPNRIALIGRQTDDVSAHNIYIGNVDYTTGVPLNDLEPVLFVAGSNQSGGAVRAYRITDPTLPQLVASPLAAGYMHDAASLVIEDLRKDTQCVNAVDACTVLIDYNETTFALWDFSSIANPAQLSNLSYPNASYVHSGWWSEDKQYVFVHDELDEQRLGLPTTLRVFSIANLGSPVLSGSWAGQTTAIDHNGYVRGNRYYMSNYTRGLTVLDITDPTNPAETGRFDTFMISDGVSFSGAWGIYPFLQSGTLLVSDINSGLYVLDDNTLDVPQGYVRFSRATEGGDEGTTVDIQVERGFGALGATQVGYETLAGSATGADFQPVSGTLSWAASDPSTQSIPISLAADAEAEGTERFFVRLFDPRNGMTLRSPSLISVFVHDPGTAAEIEFASPTVDADEGLAKAYVTVRRLGAASVPAAVSYQTVAGSAGGGVDFIEVSSGQLSWDARDATARVIEIDLVDDSDQDAGEFFDVTLSAPVGAALGGVATTRVMIVDNDSNRSPAALAGPDQTVAEGTNVSLDGRGSSDPDGDPLGYAWIQTAGPTVALFNADRAVASFTAPAVSSNTTLAFDLTVTDIVGSSTTASTRVTVTDSPGGGGGGGDRGGGATDWLLLLAGCAGLLRRLRQTRALNARAGRR